MNKTINTIFIITLLLFCTLSSCKKVLEQQPKNSTYLQAYWKSAADANSALSGDYSLLRAALTFKENSYYMYSDAEAQNYFTIQYNGDGIEPIQVGNFIGAYNVNSLGNWTRFYKVISMSNLIIKQLPTMSDNQLSSGQTDPQTLRNSIIGQALFIRAYAYFMLTRVWGDVPLEVTSYDNPVDAPQLGRSPKADIFKQIEADCHQAAGLLSWGYLSAQDVAVTANKGSVYALLTHLYLWRATMSDVNSATPNAADINSADTTVRALIQNGNYTLTDTSAAAYKKMFIGRSSESIFEINMSEDSKEGSTIGIGLQFLPTQYLATAGNNPRDYVAPAYIATNYKYNDSIVNPNPPYQKIISPVTDSTDIRYRNNFTATNTTKPICLKYSNVVYRGVGQTQPYQSNNMILFRLSDMLLLQAEIAVYKNDLPTAITIINGWRKKHGGNSKDSVASNATRDDVMHQYIVERGRELYIEGHIFWDILRTRTYGDFISWLGLSRFRQEGFYWPVDPSLFQNNIHLVQTHYWAGQL